MLFDKRFGCLEEEINKEAQTFIKAVGDFLANAVELTALFIGRRVKELEKSCKPSKETERDRAGFFKFLLAGGKLTKDDWLANAWLRETLRLYPVLSSIPRKPKEDIILGGYHIPGVTAQVEFLVHQIGRDESIFEDAV
ncbi:hypothetical protein pdam_00007149 [Pocillopora damicornis]|uniref:Uncharacterized protein n=1 Tax=Pocillopora damicornis TaxID=46731 RepID=A0A3M6TEF3_POCDA|nr:hypothetical protein pdam_00007149 [Pocillopora damicornis]